MISRKPKRLPQTPHITPVRSGKYKFKCTGLDLTAYGMSIPDAYTKWRNGATEVLIAEQTTTKVGKMGAKRYTPDAAMRANMDRLGTTPKQISVTGTSKAPNGWIKRHDHTPPTK